MKEGKIVAKVNGDTGVLVEALCETDFVATNEKFVEYVNNLAAKVAEMDETGDLSAKVAEMEKDNLTGMIATIGENMQIRRALRYSGNGRCAAYIHGGGRIGVMVQVDGDATDEQINDLCMHIAAFKPSYVKPRRA